MKWEAPETSCFKLNTDGSSLGNPGVGSVGGVIRNSRGDWLVGLVKGIPIATNNLSELLALMQGLEMAMKKNLIPLEVTTDSFDIIQMLNNGNLIYDPIISQCRLPLERLGKPAVKHSYRAVVDLLAKKGKRRKQATLFGSSSYVCCKCYMGRHTRNYFWKNYIGL